MTKASNFILFKQDNLMFNDIHIIHMRNLNNVIIKKLSCCISVNGHLFHSFIKYHEMYKKLLRTKHITITTM